MAEKEEEGIMNLHWDDQQILEQINKGNHRGLEALFHQYYSFLVRTAFYITNDQALAEDIAQEAIIKVWDKRNKLNRVENLKAYVSRMVRNSALYHMSKSQSSSRQLEQFLYFEERVAEITDLQSEDIKAELSKALTRLPPKCRLIFSMNRFEGLTNDEIAGYLNISKRTVETQISKALKILRVELKYLWDQYFLGLVI